MAIRDELEANIPMLNIAEHLDDKKLEEIGQLVLDGFTIDDGTRGEWLEKQDDYLRLASQIWEKKSFPWKDASNVKYPLLTIASLQFAARAYQTLFPNADIVNSRVVGEDPDGAKALKANRISKYMSYQLLEEDECWEDEMDRLCTTLPILGNVFKKTYRGIDKNVSEIILPKDLVINFYAKSLETATRKTHILYYYPNEIVEKINAGEFLPHNVESDEKPSDSSATMQEYATGNESKGMSPPPNDPDTPILYLEQHRLYDLDGDGYEEPYIVTIKKSTAEVVRMVANYDAKGIIADERGGIIKIIPIQYFTNFIFIPDPVSGVYGLGFGSLLGPLNEAANTLINQLIDSGTINNLQSGFIGRGIRIPHGDKPLAPGEWRYVSTAGDKIRDNIVPLVTKEPSQVLFTLLGMMIESGFNVGSIADIMMGKNPGQNQPFSTTSEVLKQGQQVFSSIHKRLHRALKKEFRKLYRLNKLYLDKQKYFSVLDPTHPASHGGEAMGSISPDDFNNEIDFDVFPASDPTQMSSIERMEKGQLLMQLMPTGLINSREAIRQILEGARIDDIDKILTVEPPGPNFDQQIELQRLQLENQELKFTQLKTEHQAVRDQANSILAMAKAESEKQMRETETLKVRYDALLKEAELKLKGAQVNLESKSADMDRRMKLLEEQNKLVIAKHQSQQQASAPES